jgi:hypothetical protein
MSVNNVGNRASIHASSPQPPEREAAHGGPTRQVSAAPLQSLRKTAGSVANGLMGAVRQTSALTTATLLAVASDVLVPGAEAARYRQAPPSRGAPPRGLLEQSSPATSGQRGPTLAGVALPVEPLLVAGVVVAGVGALAVAGVAAYNKWTADPKATE